jgi:hypothetical protein
MPDYSGYYNLIAHSPKAAERSISSRIMPYILINEMRYPLKYTQSEHDALKAHSIPAQD